MTVKTIPESARLRLMGREMPEDSLGFPFGIDLGRVGNYGSLPASDVCEFGHRLRDAFSDDRVSLFGAILSELGNSKAPVVADDNEAYIGVADCSERGCPHFAHCVEGENFCFSPDLIRDYVKRHVMRP